MNIKSILLIPLIFTLCFCTNDDKTDKAQKEKVNLYTYNFNNYLEWNSRIERESTILMQYQYKIYVEIKSRNAKYEFHSVYVRFTYKTDSIYLNSNGYAYEVWEYKTTLSNIYLQITSVSGYVLVPE